MQELGRCGRDSNQAERVMYYNNKYIPRKSHGRFLQDRCMHYVDRLSVKRRLKMINQTFLGVLNYVNTVFFFLKLYYLHARV